MFCVENPSKTCSSLPWPSHGDAPGHRCFDAFLCTPSGIRRFPSSSTPHVAIFVAGQSHNELIRLTRKRESSHLEEGKDASGAKMADALVGSLSFGCWGVDWMWPSFGQSLELRRW